jgi:hypothetical protein
MSPIFRLPVVLVTLLLGLTTSTQAQNDGTIVLGQAVTVLTLAGDGAWGTATEASTGRAIAFAIRDCKAMSQRPLGCGAMFTTIHAGWSVAVLCGDEPIIAASTELAEAERMATRRETELRQVYRRNLPLCMRIATINPSGVAVNTLVEALARR